MPDDRPIVERPERPRKKVMQETIHSDGHTCGCWKCTENRAAWAYIEALEREIMTISLDMIIEKLKANDIDRFSEYAAFEMNNQLIRHLEMHRENVRR